MYTPLPKITLFKIGVCVLTRDLISMPEWRHGIAVMAAGALLLSQAHVEGAKIHFSVSVNLSFQLQISSFNSFTAAAKLAGAFCPQLC